MIETESAPHRTEARAAGGRLSRAAINFIVDGLLLVNFVIMVWLVLLLNVVFPAPSEVQGHRLWGLGYDAYSRLLCGVTLVMCGGILLHLILHWNWVCSFVRSRVAKFSGQPAVHNKATNTLYGVGMLIVILLVGGSALAVAEITIVSPS